MRRLAEHKQRQNAHSLYLTFATLLMSLTLIVDLLFHRAMVAPGLVWLLLGICLAGGAAAYRFGSRVPRWIGLSGVLVFVVAQSFFLSLQDDPQSVVSSIQQFPVAAFYLGWFVRPRWALPLMALCLISFGTVMALNPLLHADGAIGSPVAVHGMLSLLFCYLVGYYLWRRQVHTAETDPLTGVCNRRGLTTRLEQRLDRLRRAPESPTRRFSLVVIDFDDFKRLNDDQGHAAGDLMLRQNARAWRAEMRAGDLVARVGGDEFALLLPGVAAEECEAVVKRLIGVSTHPWSWGAASALPDDTPQSLFARADQQMLERKRRPNPRRGFDRERTRARYEARVGLEISPGSSGSETEKPATRALPVPERRRVGGPFSPVIELVAAAVRRFVAWQTPYSFVSAMISAVMVIVFLSDLVIGHEHMQRGMVRLWLAVYLLGMLLPLLLGRRYTLWPGVLTAIGIEAWSSYFLVYSHHAHAEINALLLMPFSALYVGWFFPRAIAVPFIVCSALRVSASVIWNPDLGFGVGSALTLVSYAVLVSLFIFGGARAVRRQTRVQMYTDPLTGVLNRRGLARAAAEMRRRARRTGRALSLVVIDFDYFKELNERGGHAAGDDALVESAAAWRELVGMRDALSRPPGIVARLGGDEFLLLVEADLDGVERLLLEARRRSDYAWSWGAAALRPGEGLDSAVARADALLYRAKQRL